MELKKFTKNKKQNRIVIGSIVGILLLIGGISLYQTFALYKIDKTFNVLEGTVPNFSRADIKLAIKKDGQEVDAIPSKESGNYVVSVECDNGTGSWNYSKWQAEVKDFKKGSKCSVAFTTSTDPTPITPYENGYFIIVYTYSTGATNAALKVIAYKNGLAIPNSEEVIFYGSKYSDPNGIIDISYGDKISLNWTVTLKKDTYVNGKLEKSGKYFCFKYNEPTAYSIYIVEE